MSTRSTVRNLCLGLSLSAALFNPVMADSTSSSTLAGNAKPLMTLAWSPAETEAKPVHPAGMRNGVLEPEKGNELHIPGVVPMFWLTAKATPQQAKAVLDQQPEGYRCMLWVWDGLGGDPLKNDQDKLKAADGTMVRGIWADHGIAKTATAMRKFFTQYKQIGGKIDYLILDYEENFTRWGKGMSELAFDAIGHDPRFAKEGWPARIGCKNLVEELIKKPYPTDHQVKWNRVMSGHIASVLNQSIYEPVSKIFPDIKMSNYGNAYKYNVPDLNGHLFPPPSMPIAKHFGTHQSADTYGSIKDGLKNKKLDGESFGDSPFQSLILGVNSARDMAASSSVGVMPWISFRAYVRNCFYGNTDYYQELVLHVAMTNPDVLLLWNPYPWKPKLDPSMYNSNKQDQLVGRLVGEFNQLVGYADREPVSTKLAAWHALYLLSGMTVGDQTIWRFTPRLDLTTNEKVSATLVSKHPLTFRVGDKTLVFPNGTLKETGDDAPLGFWIVTPASTRLSFSDAK